MDEIAVFVAAALAIGGISLCVYGLYMWYISRQRVLAWSALMRGERDDD